MARDAMKNMCPDLIRGRNPKATLVTPGEDNYYSFSEFLSGCKLNIPLLEQVVELQNYLLEILQQ